MSTGNQHTPHSRASLIVSPEEVETYKRICRHKSCRKHLRILVVEDQVFSQRLLCQILQDSRHYAKSDAPRVDVAAGIHEGWALYLEEAHDLVFVDLCLIDGSGHTLIRAIKDLDPFSRVVVVTANNFEEELEKALENNVDDFIAKPYNKRRILDCVERCATTRKSPARRVPAHHAAG